MNLSTPETRIISLRAWEICKQGLHIDLRETRFFVPVSVADLLSAGNALPCIAHGYPAHWFLAPFAPCTPSRIPALDIVPHDKDGKPTAETASTLIFLRPQDILPRLGEGIVEKEVDVTPLQRERLAKLRLQNGVYAATPGVGVLIP